MENVRTKDVVAVDERVNDMLFSMCSKTLFGITCLVGLWGFICIMSGMLSVGGPVALVSSFLAAF